MYRRRTGMETTIDFDRMGAGTDAAPSSGDTASKSPMKFPDLAIHPKSVNSSQAPSSTTLAEGDRKLLGFGLERCVKVFVCMDWLFLTVLTAPEWYMLSKFRTRSCSIGVPEMAFLAVMPFLFILQTIFIFRSIKKTAPRPMIIPIIVQGILLLVCCIEAIEAVVVLGTKTKGDWIINCSRYIEEGEKQNATMIYMWIQLACSLVGAVFTLFTVYAVDKLRLSYHTSFYGHSKRKGIMSS